MELYFYNLAKKLDIDQLARFSKNFHMGAGIDIPNELKE